MTRSVAADGNDRWKFPLIRASRTFSRREKALKVSLSVSRQCPLPAGEGGRRPGEGFLVIRSRRSAAKDLKIRRVRIWRSFGVRALKNHGGVTQAHFCFLP